VTASPATISSRSVAGITFEGVSKDFPGPTRAVSGLDLEVAPGEFMVFVGPSGCGKTTALRMVAGLETITEGRILIENEPVNDVAAKDRDIAMVFQTYALYPHMSVFDNMAFGLKLRKLPRSDIEGRVRHAAELLGLSDLLDRKPRALSGGQRQRVAMGRAIVREPKAFLMDEPLSNLDAKLRVQMRAEISALQRDLGVTTIYVTHDQVEAMTMGDRVAVLRRGELQQVAPPQELYDQPTNLFVAGFIGSPAMNLVLATPHRSNGGMSLRVGSTDVQVGDDRTAAALAQHENEDVVLGIRPEHLADAAFGGEGPRIGGTVRVRETLGSEVMVHVEIEGRPAVTTDVRELAADTGEEDTVAGMAGRTTTILVSRLSPRTTAKPGDSLDLTLDPTKLHVFDPLTGDALGGGGGP